MKNGVSRRITLFALAMAGVGWLVPMAQAQSPAPISPGGLDLQTTLQKGLKARRPIEFQFIANVSQMVADGELDESLVITAFLSARKHRPYPFPYFLFTLQRLAPNVGGSLF